MRSRFCWPLGLALILTGGCGSTPAKSPQPDPSVPPHHPPLQGAAAVPQPPARGGGSVSGTVELDPKFQQHAEGARALYVIARDSAERTILAVRKEENPHLPFAFRLTSADAMTHGTPLKGPMDITVRLSRSGDAMPGGGDLEGKVAAVASGVRDVRVVLKTVLH